MEETTAPAATPPPPPPPPTTTTTTTTTSTANTAVPSKSLQELGMEGQKVLEATVEAAHETLASMNEVLCNPALWVTSQPTLPATVAAPSSSLAPMTSPSTLTSSSLVASTVGTSSLSAVTSSSSPLAESDVNRTNPSEQEAGWAALDESRLRLRSSTTSLRTVITAIFNSPEIRDQEDPSNGLIDQSDPDELEKLEKRVAELRAEVMNKNKVVKVLIDELRDFISDISMWQSSSL